MSRDFCFSARFCLGFFPTPAHAIPRLFVCVIHIPVAEDIAALTSETTFEVSWRETRQPQEIACPWGRAAYRRDEMGNKPMLAVPPSYLLICCNKRSKCIQQVQFDTVLFALAHPECSKQAKHRCKAGLQSLWLAKACVHLYWTLVPLDFQVQLDGLLL